MWRIFGGCHFTSEGFATAWWDNTPCVVLYSNMFFQAFFIVLIKKAFKILHQELSISRVSFMPLKKLLTKLCDQHLSICEEFSHKILPDPTHPLHSYIIKVRSILTWSSIRPIPPWVNTHRNSTVTYLACILTNRDRVSGDFGATYLMCSNHSSIGFFFLHFYNLLSTTILLFVVVLDWNMTFLYQKSVKYSTIQCDLRRWLSFSVQRVIIPF